MMTREEASRHLHNDWYIKNGHLCVYENARDLFLESNDEEPRCMECWDNYLFVIVNGEVEE